MTLTVPVAQGPEATLTGWLEGDDAASELAHLIVNLLRELPGVRSVETQVEWEIAALAAVALRRGRRCGRRVGVDDLEALGLHPEVIQAAWVVGGGRRRDEERERQVALAASETTKLVWVVFWLARVEVAREHRKRSTWMTLATRAERETEAVLSDVAEPQGEWLRERLAASRHPRRG